MCKSFRFELAAQYHVGTSLTAGSLTIWISRIGALTEAILFLYVHLHSCQTMTNVAERLRLYGQASKRMRWMPRRQEAMKDVVVCDKPRGAGKQALIRGFPNGETHCVSSILT